MPTIDAILDDVIAREAGFVNDPDDSGGPTKFGITLRILAAWRGVDVTADDVAALTHDDAEAIYRKKFVEDPGFLPLPDPLRAAVVDLGVQTGPVTATKILQKALGVQADGVIGPCTLAAVTHADVRRILVRFTKLRVLYLLRIMDAQPRKLKFRDGWLNRAWEFLEAL
jgi:lysozyme family protein